MRRFLRENLRSDKLKFILSRAVGRDGRTAPLPIELLILGGLLFLRHSQFGWQIIVWLSVLPATLLGVYTGLLTGFLSSLLQIAILLFFVRLIRRMHVEGLIVKLYLALVLLRVFMFLLPTFWSFLPIAVRDFWQFLVIYPFQLMQSFLFIFFQIFMIMLHSPLLRPILGVLFLIFLMNYFFGGVIAALLHLLGIGSGVRRESKELTQGEWADIAYQEQREKSRKEEEERSRQGK